MAKAAVALAPVEITLTQTGWRAATVVAGDHELRYWETGDGPPLIVLHGGGGPDLAPAYAALGAQARVICIQLPGFAADGDAAPATFALVADVVARAVAGLGVSSFSLLGVSFGGATAAWLATQRRELIERLILVAPAALRAGGAPAPLAPGELATALRLHPERGLPDPVSPEIAERRFAYVQSVFQRSDDADLRAALAGLDVPTMIVFGTRDGLIAPETGREYKRLIPRSDLVFVYDAAHEVARDRPEAFAGLVGDFLRRGEAHVVSRTSRLINP
jgi:pimeloyl-ACP methyl ester carboxylesterase